MSTYRRHWFRRVIVGVSVAGLGAGLMTPSPVSAAEGPDPSKVIGSLGTARTGGPDVGRQSAPKAPAASSGDFADGATHRSTVITGVPNGNTPSDQQRLLRVDVTQDLVKQQLRARINFKASPTSGVDPLVAVYFGELSGSQCVGRAAIGGTARATGTVGLFLPDTNFPVTRSRSGAVLTLTSQARSTFRTAEYDCAYAAVMDGSAGTVLQQSGAQYLTTHFTPRLAISGGEPIKAERRGKWVNLRLELRNAGRGTAANTRIVASGAGLKISPRSRTIGTLSGRSTAYGQTFKVRVAKGTKARKLTFTATANGARTTKRFTIGVAPKAKRHKSLAGRYFWGYASTSPADTRGWDTQVIWFLNKRWAHVGVPRNGVTPKCRRTTKTCKKYTYNRKKGVVRIAGRKAKVTTYGFSYTAPKDKRRFYEPVTFPKKGQRFATNLINNDWRGNCLLMCTATISNLTLDKKGRFLRGSFSVGSWPGLGSSWSSIPPDQRGTYRVISRGRVELRYASGKVERTRMGLSHNALNRPSATSGIVLGSKNYYFDD